VTDAMLGRRRERLDTTLAEADAAKQVMLKVERQLAGDLEDLAAELHSSRVELGLTPQAVQRVVAAGLVLGRQQPLTPTTISGVDAPTFTVPPLVDAWARAVADLPHPTTGKPRPITFDGDSLRDPEGRNRRRIVHLHLGHPLVQQCLRLLRAEVWSGGREAKVCRVTAGLFSDAALPEPAVLAHGRLVVTGGAGTRLHEQIITAGGWLREGRFASFGTVREIDRAVVAARESSAPPPPELAERLVALLPAISDRLVRAMERRRDDRQAGIRRMLADNASHEEQTAKHALTELAVSIRAALADSPYEQMSLFDLSGEERTQLDRDVEALRRRLERIPDDIEETKEAVRRRYADPTPRFFPVAVEFLVPRRLAR